MIEQGKTPLVLFEEYIQRYGRQMAEWAFREEYKNFTRLVLVDSGAYNLAAYREHARENATLLGIAYEEIKGSPAYFENMVKGQWDKDSPALLSPHPRRCDLGILTVFFAFSVRYNWLSDYELFGCNIRPVRNING
ncbi:DUF1638 domain-containing protein [Chloroflexota bacterium]